MIALIKIPLFILLFIIILSLLNFLMAIRPGKIRTLATPVEFGLRYKDISFNTSDGVLLKGWFIPARSGENKKSIILCHGYPADKNNLLSIADFLTNGFNVLLFDFRYFGESGGRITTVGFRERKDLTAAVKWLKENKPSHVIGAMGFSLGASTIIMANSPDVKAIVADSPFASIDKMVRQTYSLFPGFTKMPFVWLTEFYAHLFFRVNPWKTTPAREISKITSPILFIHGAEDSQIPVENSRILYEASNKEKTKLWIVLGADHGQIHSLYQKEYEGKILEFFENNL